MIETTRPARRTRARTTRRWVVSKHPGASVIHRLTDIDLWWRAGEISSIYVGTACRRALTYPFELFEDLVDAPDINLCRGCFRSLSFKANQ